METPASTIVETIDHAPASLPPALVEGLKLVADLNDQKQAEEFTRWLAHHPDLAIDLARFIRGEGQLQRLLDRGLGGDATGTTAGRYELHEALGHGTFGIVYRAYDRELKREVALKRVLRGSYLLPDELARFRREAELAASLQHPNIVPVLDYGESMDGPYLVMPIMVRSLAMWLKSLGPDRLLPWKEAAQKVRVLALAIHHAHQRALVHRDLKPGNILLDQDGRLHIADFGLARQLDATLSTGIAGTAAYMAPEQVRGEKVPTTALDIHALGAILFELLTGAPPFGTDGVHNVLKRVMEEQAHSIRDVRTDVPDDLEYVCRKCLEKQAADRYLSAQALADDLTLVIKGVRIPSRGKSILTGFMRAFRHRVDPSTMTTWPTAFWGTAWSLIGLGVLQLSLLLNGPAWLNLTLFATYFIGWITLVWVLLCSRHDELNPVEYGSLAIHLGMFFASISVVCTQLWLHDGDVLYVFPPLGAVLGLAVFVHGLNYWGRLYVIGLFALAISAAMPAVPKVNWPSVYGLTVAGCQAWAGIVLRRYHLDLQAMRRTSANSSMPPPTT